MSMQLENLEITARENLMISFFVLFVLILWIISYGHFLEYFPLKLQAKWSSTHFSGQNCYALLNSILSSHLQV